jgi:cyclophilin family peptidyl-prolyl cis-trans isomerase
MIFALNDVLDLVRVRWRELVSPKAKVKADRAVDAVSSGADEAVEPAVWVSVPVNPAEPSIRDRAQDESRRPQRAQQPTTASEDESLVWSPERDASNTWSLQSPVLSTPGDTTLQMAATDSVLTPSASATAGAATTSSASSAMTTMGSAWGQAFMSLDKLAGSSVLLGAAVAAVAHQSDVSAPDKTPPLMAVTTNTASLKAGQTATVTFTLSEPSSNFSASAVTVTGGTLSNFAGSGTTFTATYTPNANSTTAGSVSVASNKFRDVAGNANLDGADANNRVDFSIDTVAPAAPRAMLDGSWTINPQVTLQVNLGGGVTQDVVVEVYPNEVGLTVSNWLAYVNTNFYNGLIFHRVISGVVQGGGFTANMVQKAPTYDPVVLESGVHGLSNLDGTIAMARTTVNDSATSQFFFNLADHPGYDYVDANSPGYAVFGKVISGMPTLQTILGALNPTSDVPTTLYAMDSVSTTLSGKAYSSTGIIYLGGLEQSGQWSYSLDGGTVWVPITTAQINLGTTPGDKVVTIRQIDSAGNVSASSTVAFTQYTPDDLHSVLDLATASDTSGGAAGTDTDNITQSTTLSLSAVLAAWANHEVWLMDQGKYVATSTANATGDLSWLVTGASSGSHVYTLYDPLTHVRVLAPGGVAVSELHVQVL